MTRLPSIAVSLIVLVSLAAGIRGGPVSLSQSEPTRLAALVKSDEGARARFEELRKAADAALRAEPDPVKHILSEGRLKNDPDRIRTQKSMADMQKLRALGFAYAVTGKPAYAERARHFLLAWAKVNQSRGDPIDDTGLEPAVVAYDLVRGTCTADERQRIDAWLRQVARAEVESARTRPGSTKNNWHSHRLKIVGLVGLLLRDRELIDWTVAAFKKHVDRNLNPDGSRAHDPQHQRARAEQLAGVCGQGGRGRLPCRMVGEPMRMEAADKERTVMEQEWLAWTDPLKLRIICLSRKEGRWIDAKIASPAEPAVPGNSSEHLDPGWACLVRGTSQEGRTAGPAEGLQEGDRPLRRGSDETRLEG